jgi:hypothetical protein
VKRTLKHGQCRMRVIRNEKEHTIEVGLMPFAVLIMRGLLSGT